MDTIINSHLSFSDFGIYFKENNTKENIEKKYGDKIKQIYNYIGKNSKIFRIIIYNKTYQITKDSFDNLIWTLDEDYAKTDDSTN